MRTFRLGVASATSLWLIFCGAAAAVAQPPPPDVRAIAAALAEEQARITELKAELDRRSAALAELTRVLEAVSPSQVVTAPAQPTPPKPTPDAPAAPPPVPPRFQFYGETKVRYETLRHDYEDCVGCPDRKRGRLRLRFGAEGRVAPDFTAVLGFGVGELNDPNTVYVNLGDNFSRKVATWDRGYVEYHPSKMRWMNLTAGKFPYTWLRSSMTFDVDFYPEGLSQRFSFDLPRVGRLQSVGVQAFELIAREQPIDRHMTIVGTQLTAKLQPSAHIATSVVVTGVNIAHPEFLLRALLDGSDVGVRNTNAIVLNDGVPSYHSGFRYINAIVENAVTTPWPALPVTVGVEYQHNLRAATERDKGVSIRFDAGRAQRTGDWNFGWHLFRVEQDAILAGLGESDWRAPSNVLQHRFAVDRMVHPNVQLSFTLYRGRTLDRTLPGALLAPGLPASLGDPWMNRMYLDVTYRY
jgi:hypothetical protein